MAHVGKLAEKDGMVMGRLSTLTQRLDLVLEDREPAGQGTPTHTVYAKARNELVQIGVAWRRKIEKGGQAGQPMFSLSLDDPSWPMALNVNAYPDGNPGSWDIVWRRERREATNGEG